MANISAVQSWLRLAALLAASIAVLALMAFMSVSGPAPKSVVYGPNPNLFYELYVALPLISTVAGLAAVVLAVIALSRSPRALMVAGAGVGVGLVLFLVVTIMSGSLLTAAGVPPAGERIPVANWPVLALTPPTIGLAVVAIVLAAVLVLLPGIAHNRRAVAALVMGGVVSLYWLLDQLILTFGGGE